MHDGSRLTLKKLGRDYDPTDKVAALTALSQANSRGEVLTGVLYIDTERPNFLEILNLVEEPLATLPVERVRPPKQVLDEIMEELR